MSPVDSRAGRALSTPSLAAAMREGSQAAHTAAEGSVFVHRVLSGEVTAAAYLAYLERLHAVYTALEAVLEEHRHHADLEGVYDARLVRAPALGLDLAHWRRAVGHHPDDGSLRSPATAAYLARIRSAAHRPALLVAHHYTRYLGDLSGGRILRQRLHQRFGSGAGLGFYDFERIDRPVAYKRAYRDRLDGLPYTADLRAEVVAEVCVAFDLNHALLAELAGP